MTNAFDFWQVSPGGYVIFGVFTVIAINAAWIARGAYQRHCITRNLVFDDLDSAWDGGQFDPGNALQGESPEGVAYDMTCHATGCEDLTYHEMLPYVRKWMRMRGLIS